MTYTGPERRKHRVYVTENSEYHMRGELCVAVRNPKTHEWQKDHVALGKKLVAGISMSDAGTWKLSLGGAEVGEKIFFSNDIMTTAVVAVDRPSRKTVECYPVRMLD